MEERDNNENADNEVEDEKVKAKTKENAEE